MNDPNAFINSLIRQIEEHARSKVKYTTAVTLACFDGEYTFRLTMRGIDAVEVKAGVGIGAVYGNVMRGVFNSGHDAVVVPTEGAFSPPVLMEIIRQGLIGGNKCIIDGVEKGVTSLLANHLIETYLSPANEGSLLEAWNISAAIMHAMMHGIVIEEPASDDVEPAKPKRRRRTQQGSN